MKYLLQLEELGQLVLGVLLLAYLPVSIAWWLWPLVFLSPDISMLGYLLGARAGAWSYNLFHHKGMAVVLVLVGYFGHLPLVLFIGVLLWAHSSFDRLLGYGLKHSSGFQDTHLGNIGKKQGIPEQPDRECASRLSYGS